METKRPRSHKETSVMEGLFIHHFDQKMLLAGLWRRLPLGALQRFNFDLRVLFWPRKCFIREIPTWSKFIILKSFWNQPFGKIAESHWKSTWKWYPEIILFSINVAGSLFICPPYVFLLCYNSYGWFSFFIIHPNTFRWLGWIVGLSPTISPEPRP